MITKPFVVLLLVFALAGIFHSTAYADNPDDIFIVTNTSNPMDSVSNAELKAIFLKQKGRWKNGVKAIPIHAKEGTALRKAFLRRLFKMEPSRERAYWQEQKISRGILPPPSFSSALRAVFQIKGSVSYVYRRDYKEGVAKILMVLDSE